MSYTKNLSMVLLVFLASLSVACGDNNGACTDAQEKLENKIKHLCKKPGYASNSFCSTCVDNDYYSVSAFCECRKLSLTDGQHDGRCYYDEDVAESEVKNAVDYAVAVCQRRSAIIPGDAGTE